MNRVLGAHRIEHFCVPFSPHAVFRTKWKSGNFSEIAFLVVLRTYAANDPFGCSAMNEGSHRMLRARAYASLSLMPPANLMLVFAYRLSSVFCPSCERYWWTITPTFCLRACSRMSVKLESVER